MRKDFAIANVHIRINFIYLQSFYICIKILELIKIMSLLLPESDRVEEIRQKFYNWWKRIVAELKERSILLDATRTLKTR